MAAAKSSERIPRRAGWFERTAWTLGGALLLTFGGLTLWTSYEHRAGVAAFRQAQEAYERSAATPHAPPIDGAEYAEPSAAPFGTTSSAPDTSLWSASRVQAYLLAGAGEEAAPLAILNIPSVGLEAPIFGGASERNLNRGAGWIEGTAPLGAEDNTGVAGHRDGYFRALKDVSVGDSILVQTLQTEFKYRVTRIDIVSPDAVHVLAPTSRASLTLVTCYPFYYVGPAPQRYIVRAERTDAGDRAIDGVVLAAQAESAQSAAHGGAGAD